MQETIPLFTETEETKKPTFDFKEVDGHVFLTSDPNGREFSILFDHHVDGVVFKDWIKNQENYIVDNGGDEELVHLSHCDDIGATYPGDATIPLSKNRIIKQNACAIFYVKSKSELGARGPYWAGDVVRDFMEKNVPYIPGTREYVGGSILDKAGDPTEYYAFIYYSETSPVQ